MGRALTDENRLSLVRPDIAAQWHSSLNGDLTPDKVTVMSNKKVAWACNHGHEWKATVHNRSKGQGCPYCSGRYATKDNNLTKTNPELIKEWDFNKNKIRPEHVKRQSNKKVWWVCGTDENHKWEASIDSRTRISKTGCPYCANQKVDRTNCLANTDPWLEKEWDYERNKHDNPYAITSGSNKKVWWVCLKNKQHKWRATPNQRSGMKTGCPECYKGKQTSFPEQAIYFYVRKVFKDAINRYVHPEFKNKAELDVFIPAINVGIEYDGIFHKSKKAIARDERKNKFCYELGIELIRIRHSGLPNINNYNSVVIKHDVNDKNSLSDCLSNLFERLKKYNIIAEIDFDIEKNYIEIIDMMDKNEHDNSLAVNFPYLLREWNYERNLNLDPEKIYPHTSMKVWWRCEKGHEWKTSVSHRTGVNKTKCPYCSGKKACDINSLMALNEGIASEWNYAKNGDLTPSDVTLHSNKNVWWIGKCGHEWKAQVNSRSRGTGCPYCCGKKVNADNCLSKTHPNLSDEWHPLKNGSLTPNDVTCGSSKSVWWVCNEGHEWKCNIHDRSSKDYKCHFCSGKRATLENNLAIAKPELVKEWDFEKNNPLTPYDLLPQSSKKVWWICKNEHEYDMTVTNRFKGKGWPYCSGRKATSENNLLKKHPEIAQQWNYEKNGDLRPEQVLSGSGKKVWWKCSQGHEWFVSPNNRTSGNTGCPECNRRNKRKKANTLI